MPTTTASTQVTLAGLPLDESLAFDLLRSYARAAGHVVRYYDCGGRDSAPRDERDLDLATIGRATLHGDAPSGRDVAALLGAATTAPWRTVPADATLVDADPALHGGLYDAAEGLYRHFLRSVPAFPATALSRVLHLTRPALFPILDASVRRLYQDLASQAWYDSPRTDRPRSNRSYWPAIRADVIANGGALARWREGLAGCEEAACRRLSTVSDVRLWDAVVHTVTMAME